VKIQILPGAEQDLIDGFYFYQMQEIGAGACFLSCLYSDIDSLRFFAEAHPVVSGFRRLLSKRLPFAVYYRIEADIVFIYAMLDCRRDPAWAHEQL
jgi:hypothetical protein